VGFKKLSRHRFLRAAWDDYKRNRVGMLGLFILALFILVAILAPVITPYDPISDKFLAESYAYPSWFTLSPSFHDLPRTITFKVEPKIDSASWRLAMTGPVGVAIENDLSFNLESTLNASGSVTLTHRFEYDSAPPQSFDIKMSYRTVQENVHCKAHLTIETPRGDRYLLWNSTSVESEELAGVEFRSKGASFAWKSALGLRWFDNVASFIFSSKGEYRILFVADFTPVQSPSRLKLQVRDLFFIIPGLVHGWLGTDHIGADLFSQLVYGSRVSLVIGITASILATAVGLFAGVIAGYVGGYLDEGLMRLVDILLVLPFLPLLMVTGSLFGRSIWNLILLLGILSWPGFARVVRAQVLQLKTATFVDAARAMGGSRLHIMIRHLTPNVLPYVYASIALAIPGFIITEAALSFLALGDPATPSWGRMFYTANAFGAFRTLAWWWIIPPGIAITLISLSFVFIGHTLDEILNPRLKARSLT